jgi:hypothetical protein
MAGTRLSKRIDRVVVKTLGIKLERKETKQMAMEMVLNLQKLEVADNDALFANSCTSSFETCCISTCGCDAQVSDDAVRS